MEKGYAYLRVSGCGQVDGDGFPRQLEAIKLYAQANNIRIVKVFHEEGICGETELEHRPALMALFEALAANGTKLVLIEKLDRLARKLMVQETIIGNLRKRGFDLISVTEPDLLQDDEYRTLMRQIFGAIAQYEKAMIARQRMKAKTGRCEGAKPFGMKPGEEAVLERISSMRESGTSLQGIADALNNEGIAPRRGSKWHANAVRRIAVRSSE